MCKKWPTVPELESRLSIFFIDRSGVCEDNLFSCLDSTIRVALETELARAMSVQVEGMTVYQLHYRLLPSRPIPAVSVATRPSPSFITSDVPLSKTEIGSSARTPTLEPAGAVRGPLTFTHPTALTAAQMNGLLLSGAMAGPEGYKVPKDKFEVPIHPVDTGLSLDISDNTMASMLHACVATQVSASPSAAGCKPPLPSQAKQHVDLSCNIPRAKVENDSFTEVFKGPGHSPAAFAAFESALEMVTARMGQSGNNPSSNGPSDGFATCPVSITESSGGYSPTDCDLALAISDKTMLNIFTAFCDSNAPILVEAGPAISHRGETASPTSVKQAELNKKVPLSGPCHKEVDPIENALNAVDTTQESTPGEIVPKHPTVLSTQSISHAKIADAIIRYSDKRRQITVLSDCDGINSSEKKKRRRVTPIFMGPLTEAHRFVVGHFPATLL